MKKRLLSVLLVICMVLTLMPMSAFAAVTTITASAEGIDGIDATIDETEKTISITLPSTVETTGSVTVKLEAEDENRDTVTLTPNEVIATYDADSETWGTEAKVKVGGDSGEEYTVTVTQAEGDPEPPVTGSTIGSTVTVNPNTVTATLTNTDGYAVELGGNLAAPTDGTTTNVTLTFAVTASGASSATNETKTIVFAYSAGNPDADPVVAPSWSFPKDALEVGGLNVAVSGTVAVADDGGEVEEPVAPTLKTDDKLKDGEGKYTLALETGDTYNATVNTDATEAVTVESSNAEVATAAVQSDGKVKITAVAAGDAVIKITVPKGTSYDVGVLEVAVTVTAPTCTVAGTVSKGTSTVTDLTAIKVGLYTVDEEPHTSIKEVAPDADGKYTIADVEFDAAATYAVIVKEGTDNEDSMSSTFKLTKNGKADANITLLPAMVTLTLSTDKGIHGISAKVGTKAVPTGEKNVAKGSDVEITFTPASGYVLSALTVGDTNITGDGLTAAATSNKYTITNITAATTAVSATFAKKTYEITISGDDEDSTVTVMVNGETATADGDEKYSAAEGDKVAVKIDPGKVTDGGGNEVPRVTSEVKWAHGTTAAATLGLDDDGYYSFTMPGEAVTVTVAFDEVKIELASTPDVADSVYTNAGMDKSTVDPAVKNVSVGIDEEAAVAIVDANDGAKKALADAVADAEEKGDGSTVSMKVFTQVTPVEYVGTATADTPKSFTVNIEQVYTIVTTPTDGDPTESDPAELTVTGEIDVTIGLPDGFVSAGDPVYVKHNTDMHKATATNTDGKLTVTIKAKGLSPFTAYAENPTAVAEITNDGETKCYDTLEDAIKDVPNNGTITLVKDVDLTATNPATEITVDKAIIFTIDPKSKLTGADNIKVADASLNLVTADDGTGTKFTFTKKATNAVNVVVAGGNGTAEADVEEAYAGATVTINLNPNSGFELDTITATDTNSSTITINEDDYSFTMTGYVVTVTVKYKATATPETPETPSSGGGGGSTSNMSVPSSSGGKTSVDNKDAKPGETVNITTTPNKGKVVDTVTVTTADGKTVKVTDLGNGKYSFVMPEGKVTVKVTYKDEEAAGFVDVPASAYFADAVAWAVEKGITNGMGDNSFAPNASCTRAQMVTFLWRLAGSPKASASNPFADVDSSSYYYDAVMWAVSKGITNGTGVDTFSPDATVTRGESVTFLFRYAGKPAASGSSFSDVAASAYYADAVAWAAANGVTNGTGDNTFSPANDCTRAQIVTFMYRYAG